MQSVVEITTPRIECTIGLYREFVVIRRFAYIRILVSHVYEVTHCLKSNGGVHQGSLGANGNRADSAMA